MIKPKEKPQTVVVDGALEEIPFEDDFSLDEDKFGNNVKLRHDTEFFKEDSYVPHDMVSVRRVEFTNGDEDWEILKNKKVVLTVNGSRFSKKEKEKLGKPNGMIFLMNGYKAGWKTITEFKKQIKNLK